MQASSLGRIASELLRAHGQEGDVSRCQAQFMRVITSHGKDAGHVDAILSSCKGAPPRNTLQILEGDGACRVRRHAAGTAARGGGLGCLGSLHGRCHVQRGSRGYQGGTPD